MAAIPIIGTIVGKVLDRVLPDKVANDAAKNELAQMALKGDLDAVAGQLQVDTTEASSASWWTSGARPAIMWVCAFVIFSDLAIRPYAMFICNLAKHPVDFPVLDMSELWPLITGMLGLGTQHVWENVSKGGK